METPNDGAVLNTSLTLYPVVSHDARVVLGVIHLSITVAGIFGNGFVIFAVFASKKLQTFTNMFVVNLSVADLLACIMMQLQCYMMLSPDGAPYPLSKMTCAIVATLLCTACGCSLYTLASIAFYRLVLLTDKSRTRADKLQTLPCAIVWIGSTWIIPLLVNVITHAFAAEQFGYNKKYHVCGAESEDGRNHEIEIAQVFGLYTVAFIVITVSYGYIFCYVRRHTLETLKELDHDYESKNDKSCNWKTLSMKRSWKRTGSTTSTQSENAKQLFRRQITITKNMFYVVLAFVICITPYTVCLVFPHLNGLLHSAVLLMFNSNINPILYGFKHPHFRQVFKCLLTCRWTNVPRPSEAFKTVCKLRSRSRSMSRYESHWRRWNHF